jgi:glutamate-1-semialdehyde 2,1-aminomutase
MQEARDAGPSSEEPAKAPRLSGSRRKRGRIIGDDEPLPELRVTESEALFRQAERVMVGGVNSPVRAFRAVGGHPVVIAGGRGSKIWDVDGNQYVDYVCSWGPLILGHSHPRVLRAVIETAKRGTSFGAPSVPELRLAKRVCSSVPSIEKVRFVNSGTEATMSALRLARAYTSRTTVLKFDGCYHGHSDPFLTHAGSGLATFDLPASAGVPSYIGDDALTLPYNDVSALEAAFAKRGDSIAAAIVEPVAGNMGVVPPQPGFLEALRRLCTAHGSLLIFDEVITGFRVAPGGAQALFRVSPDITCLGKIIGGGFPVGAYGASLEIMRMVSPEGPVYQAGTLSGNPVAMAAGLATLSLLDEGVYRALEERGVLLAQGLTEAAASAGAQITVNRVGSMIGLFFGPDEVRNFEDAKRTRSNLYGGFHRAMLTQGVYLPPSAFETFFLSAAHTRADLELTVNAARRAFREAAR